MEDAEPAPSMTDTLNDNDLADLMSRMTASDDGIERRSSELMDELQKADQETDRVIEKAQEATKQDLDLSARDSAKNTKFKRDIEGLVAKARASSASASQEVQEEISKSEAVIRRRLNAIGEDASALLQEIKSQRTTLLDRREKIVKEIPEPTSLSSLKAVEVENAVALTQLETLYSGLQELKRDNEEGLRPQAEIERRKREMLKTGGALRADLDLVMKNEIVPAQERMETLETKLVELTKRQTELIKEIDGFSQQASQSAKMLTKRVDDIIKTPLALRVIQNSTNKRFGSDVIKMRDSIFTVWTSQAGPFIAAMERVPALRAAKNAQEQVAADAASFMQNISSAHRRSALIVQALSEIKYRTQEDRELAARRKAGMLSTRDGFASQCASYGARASVRMLDYDVINGDEPPTLVLNHYRDHETLVEEVARIYERFDWKPEAFPGDPPSCYGTEPKLTPYQRWAYQFFHPYQSDIPGMLFAASAGLGKSWIITLIASMHARAGFQVIMATKPTLRLELALAMFKSRADLNVQNAVEGCGLKLDEADSVTTASANPEEEDEEKDEEDLEDEALSFVDDVEDEWEPDDEDMEEDEVDEYTRSPLFKLSAGAGDPRRRKLRGRIATGKKAEERKAELKREGRLVARGANALQSMRMDYDPYNDKHAKIAKHPVNTYRTLTNTVFAWVESPEDGKRKLIIIDESHRIVAPPSELRSTLDTGNLYKIYLGVRAVQEHFPNREDWCRVALFTATPVANSPTDLIVQLNVLVDKSREWTSFLAFDQKKKAIRIQKSSENLLAQFDSKGEFLGGARDKFRRLANSCVSYISLYGDRTRFARPNIKVMRVDLSRPQEDTVFSVLKYGVKKNKIKFNSIKFKDIEKELSKAQDSAQMATLMPSAASLKKNKKRFKTIRARSPAIYKIVQALFTKNRQTVDDLELNETRGPMGGEQYFNFKKMIFLPTTNPDAASDTVQALEDRDFVAMNPVPGTLREAEPYKGFLQLLGGDSDKRPFQVPEAHPFSAYNGMTNKQAVLSIFNDRENHDGNKCLIIVISSKYREGISLKGVKQVFLPGVELSNAYIEQELARAIRLCSAKDLPPDEDGQGWSIDVVMQYVRWTSKNRRLMAKRTIRQALREMNPLGSKYYAVMDTLYEEMKRLAIDRELFAAVNANGKLPIPFHKLEGKKKPGRSKRLR